MPGWTVAQALGACVRRERLGLGYTVEEFAAETGLAAATLRQLEAGAGDRLPLSVLERVAHALGVTMSGLLWVAEQDCPPSTRLRAPAPTHTFLAPARGD